MRYEVAYDAAEAGLSFARWAAIIIMAVVVVSITVYAVFAMRQKKAKEARNAALSAVVLAGVCGLVGWNFVSTQRACERWLVGGDFETVEGIVTDFVEGPKLYTFKIAGWTFTLPKADLSYCGYRIPSIGDTPIRDGARLRLSFHGSAILRVEVARDRIE